MHVGILGGTGPLGRGLAGRFAAAGNRVTLGSRDPERAAAVAAEVADAWPAAKPALGAGSNEEAAGAEIVVVATPWEAAVATALGLAARLQGKVVVSVANALVPEGTELLALGPPRGSVAASLQARLPGALVAAAGHHLPAPVLIDPGRRLVADVLVCSDHRGATEATMALFGAIPGVRPLDAGGLAQAAALEAFTAVRVGLNRRYKVHSTLGLAGLDAERVPPRAEGPK
ncbi:MAG TPA: NADPH-dependent F420 reductase [Acidimicrobiales bacterium]|nr:NADPH-dependent F420 reductase [Acidimicrobiales bacterium]